VKSWVRQFKNTGLEVKGVSGYLSEEEQVEALKKWWKENGFSVAAGAALGLLGVFGWQAWNEHQEEIAQQASARFEQMQLASKVGHVESVVKQAEILMTEHEDSGYALFAGLLLAKVKQQEGDIDAARTQLQWVVTNGNDSSFQQIARLRLARLLLGQGDTDAATAVIAAAPVDNFAGEFAAVRGDIAHANNDLAGAREAYQEALDKGVGDSDLVRMKIDDLATVEAKP
jgi:predicted negative regulator of RcsB-dependent stress response